MGSKKIEKGDLFLCNGRAVRFITALELNSLQVQDLETREISIVTPSALSYRIDPSQPISEEGKKDLTSFTQEELELASRRHKILCELVDNSNKLVCSTQDAMNKLHLSRAQFYRVLNKFDRNANFMALIRDTRGRKTTTSLLSQQVENIVKDAIKRLYTGPGATIRKVEQEVQKLCKGAGLVPPAYGTIRLRIARTNPKVLDKQLYGHEKADQDHQVRGGKRKIHGPLHEVQMDHCLLDIIIVDEETRQPLARPWLCVAIDVYSRAVLGFYLSLNSPRAMNVALCISHAMLPKNEWLHDLQITEFDYPYYGVFKSLGVDNGVEFRNNALINGCEKYNIKIHWRKRVHHGAYIERWNGTLMEKIRGLPGATLNSVTERDKYANIPPPAMTLKETKAWLIEILNVYHKSKHEGLGASPLYTWEKYFKDSKGRVVLPEMVEDRRQLLLDFMPFKVCSLHRSGLKLETIEYYSPALLRFNNKQKFVVRYDPSSMRRVWARPENNNNYIELTYSDVSRPDISLAEFKLARKHLADASSHRVSEQEVWDALKRADDIVDDAVKKTKQAKLAKEKKETNSSEPLRAILSERSTSDYTASSDVLDYAEPPSSYGFEME
jgi:putative transposase